MSGFDTGYGTMANAFGESQRIAEQQKLARQAKLSAIVGDSLNNLPLPKDENGNPDVNNPVYQDIYNRRQKLIGSLVDEYTPTQHANLVQRIGGLITGNKKGAEAHPNQPLPTYGTGPHALQAQAAHEQGAQAAQDLASGAPPQPAEAPAVPQHPMAPLPPDHPANKITEGLAALKNHLSAFAHPIPNKPDQSELVNNLASSYADPNALAAERAQTLAAQKGEVQLQIADKRLQALLAGKPPKPVGDFVTIPHLLEQMNDDPDLSVVGPNGHEYTRAQLAELPQGYLAHGYMKGNEFIYAFGDPKTKEWHIGNAVIQVPTYGQVTPENSTNLGVATPSTETMRQTPGMNPGEVINLHGGRTPQTTGMNPVPPTGVPVTTAPMASPANPVLQRRPDGLANPVPATAQPAAPANPGARAPGTIPTGGAVKTKTSSMTPPPPFAPGTMLQQGRSAQPVVSAMSVMAANVFGGNGEAPLWENAKMYDKPDVRAALNKALTLNALATPGTEDNPSFLQTLATAVGATGWSQEQINNANVEARQDLEHVGGPEALKMFAREAALQEDLSALRTATKASAAQGSIRTLVRAAPVYNVSSAQDFRNQLGATLNTAAASLRGYPAINPEYVKWWDRGVSAAKGGPTSTSAPKTPPTRPTGVPANAVWNQSARNGEGSWQIPKAQ